LVVLVTGGLQMEEDISTKEKILKAAEEIFAEKGYDGSSLNEIAKKAGISKTQIFYYFENKKDLLNELFKHHIRKGKNFKDNLWSNVNYDSKEDLWKFYYSIATAFKTESDIMRIGLIESFKSMPNDVNFFELLDPIFEDSLIKLKTMSKDDIDEDILNEFRINMIFHNAIPLYLFYILGDKFNKYYNVDSEKSNEIFFKTLKKIVLDNILGL
jgi:AcrR family transcriptional regulator